jgi:hypothetical protein
MHPHSDDSYINLLNETWATRRKATFRGKERGAISRPIIERHGDMTFAYIPILKYYDLSPFGLWYRESTQEAVESTEESPLAAIPEDLKPELIIIPAVFISPGHQIIFDAGKMGPSTAERFFHALFSDPLLLDRFGPVDVTMIQDHEQLERILSLETITQLRIFIKRPNADDEESDEERIQRRMESMDVYRWEQVLGGQPRRRESIRPDEGLKPYMRVALENGEVRAKGYEAEQVVELSTRTSPRRQRVTVPSSMGMAEFIDAVGSILPRWRGR